MSSKHFTKTLHNKWTKATKSDNTGKVFKQDNSNKTKYPSAKVMDYKTPEEKEENQRTEKKISFSEFKKMQQK